MNRVSILSATVALLALGILEKLMNQWELLLLKMVLLRFTTITLDLLHLYYYNTYVANCMVLLIQNLLCLFLDIVAAAVLSGNRNFEGRVHPLTRANYLASPPLVVAYALAGTVINLGNLSKFNLHFCV